MLQTQHRKEHIKKVKYLKIEKHNNHAHGSVCVALSRMSMWYAKNVRGYK